VNALPGLRITDQLFKSYVFTRQSTLQRNLRRQIKKQTPFIVYREFFILLNIRLMHPLVWLPISNELTCPL
jgi:hypothetical protein